MVRRGFFFLFPQKPFSLRSPVWARLASVRRDINSMMQSATHFRSHVRVPNQDKKHEEGMLSAAENKAREAFCGLRLELKDLKCAVSEELERARGFFAKLLQSLSSPVDGTGASGLPDWETKDLEARSDPTPLFAELRLRYLGSWCEPPR